MVLKNKTSTNLFIGKYSHKLSKKKPRKKLKDPKKKINDFRNRYIYDRIIKEVKPKNFIYSEYYKTLSVFKKEINRYFKFNVFKTKGENLHIFLPLTGMAASGWFFKSFFEKTLPKARVTFLVTPSSVHFNNSHKKNKSKIGVEYPKLVPARFNHNNTSKIIENLKKNIQRSLNKHDKYFVVIDFFLYGRTFSMINKSLSELYGKENNLLNISSEIEHRHGYLKLFEKEEEGKFAMPQSESRIYEKLKKKDPSSKISKKDIKKEIYNDYKILKKKEKLVKSIYSYLGNLIANNEKIVNDLKNR